MSPRLPHAPDPNAGRVSPQEQVAIRDLLADFAWSLDTCAIERAATLFEPEAQVHYGRSLFDKAEVEGVQAFLQRWRDDPASRGHQHWFEQTWYERLGEDVVAHSFVMVAHRGQRGTPSMSMPFLGYSDARVRAGGGRWRFAQLSVNPWTGSALAGFPRYVAVEGDAS